MKVICKNNSHTWRNVLTIDKEYDVVARSSDKNIIYIQCDDGKERPYRLDRFDIKTYGKCEKEDGAHCSLEYQGYCTANGKCFNKEDKSIRRGMTLQECLISIPGGDIDMEFCCAYVTYFNTQSDEFNLKLSTDGKWIITYQDELFMIQK